MFDHKKFLGATFVLAVGTCCNASDAEKQQGTSPEHRVGTRGCAVEAGFAMPPEVVATDRGLVRGQRNGDTYSYKGIPYAAPPVGVLRWRPPQPVSCWSNVLEATAFSEVCAQAGARPGTTTTWFGSEDCLYLNVWTPRDRRPEERLPVLVFVHGGGNTRGAGSESVSTSIPTLGPNIQDGQRLAEDGHAVVVTINYRLGFFGWLAHTALSTESDTGASGNYGELDIIAALHWVRRNISNFGGDPDRLLLFGQSAGARDVCALAASQAKGHALFSTAGFLSGQCENLPALNEAEAYGQTFATNVGCGSAPAVAACLRAIPTSQVALTTVDRTKRLFANQYFQLGPIVDGDVISDQPIALFRSPHHSHVPVLIGSTDNETAFSLLPLMYTGPINTGDDYVNAINQLAAGTSIIADIISAYPLSEYSSPRNALIAVLTDANLVCPARRMARAFSQWDEPVWRAAYLHTNSNGPSQTFGPAHVMDLGYWFDTLWQMPDFVPTATEGALARTMPLYLAAFAASGDPNYASAPVIWPRFDVESDAHLRIETPLSPDAGFHAGKCNFWDSHLPPAGWDPTPWHATQRRFPR